MTNENLSRKIQELTASLNDVNRAYGPFDASAPFTRALTEAVHRTAALTIEIAQELIDGRDRQADSDRA